MISSFTNFLGNLSNNAILPEGAIINPEAKEIDLSATYIYNKTSVITVLNHTNFKIDRAECSGKIIVNGQDIAFKVGSSSVFEEGMDSHNFKLTAFCMEDHSDLFFFDIRLKSVINLFTNSNPPLMVYIDMKDDRNNQMKGKDFIYAKSADEKISEIGKYITEKRKFNLVLNGYFSDKKSSFYNSFPNQDVISVIGKQYMALLEPLLVREPLLVEEQQKS